MTPAWANHVDESLAELWEQNERQEKRLLEGTDLMQKIDDKVSSLTQRALPLIEGMEHMQAGIRVIGAIGGFIGRVSDFLWRWLKRFAQWGLGLLALWLFSKALLSGHSMSEAWEVALRVLK